MDSVVCGASAFLVWRTPPLVRELAELSLDNKGLPVSFDRLREVRAVLMRELDLWRRSTFFFEQGRPPSDASEGISLNVGALAPSVSMPVDVLVGSPGARRGSRLLRPHVLSPALSEGEVVPLAHRRSLTSPALTLLQLASSLSLPRLVMAASEFCGSFSVYRPPDALRELIEELAAGSGVPVMGGWRPSFEREGHPTDVWSRPPLATPSELRALAERAAGRRGCRALARAAELVVPDAASPFEVQTGMLLGLVPELGGEGHGGFSHNGRLDLDARAQSLAGQSTCYCDLLWPGGGERRALDVECHSAMFHEGEGQRLSDADRALALQSMGIEVLFVTYAQIASERRADALARTVAEKLGSEVVPRTDEFLARRAELRREVLVDFCDLLA